MTRQQMLWMGLVGWMLSASGVAEPQLSLCRLERTGPESCRLVVQAPPDSVLYIRAELDPEPASKEAPWQENRVENVDHTGVFTVDLSFLGHFDRSKQRSLVGQIWVDTKPGGRALNVSGSVELPPTESSEQWPTNRCQFYRQNYGINPMPCQSRPDPCQGNPYLTGF